MFVTIAVYSLDTCGGRRLQYLIGTTIMVLGTILSATGLSQNVESAVAFVGICVFAAGFQLSQGILAWAYPAEIFNMHERQTTGKPLNGCSMDRKYCYELFYNIRQCTLESNL